MRMFLTLAIIVLVTEFCHGTPTRNCGKNVATEDDMRAYLECYGYNIRAPKHNAQTQLGDLRQSDDLAEAVRTFQRFANIQVTGVLDKETLEMMNMPRCGVRDVDNSGTLTRRRKRYAPQGSRWGHTNLKYKIRSYSQDLPKDKQKTIFKRAFKVWSDATRLTFDEARADKKADIDISFARREHGDNNPFDGRGGTLAHAYFPQFGGDAHFDEDEHFTDGSYSGSNLLQVAAHEFGHSLGLGHSQHKDALMAPFYRGYKPSFKLHKDDIDGIKALYGGLISPGKKPTSKKPTGPQLCQNAKFDAIFTHEKYGTFAFSGDQFLKLTRNGVENGYPRKISQTFSHTRRVDAAFAKDFYASDQSKVTVLFLFEGYRVVGYRFHDKHAVYDSSSKASTDKLFRGLRMPIDAIFTWSRNGRTYAIRGSQYYRLNDEDLSVAAADPPYPRPLSVWGLPLTSVDSVVRYENGRTYFFSGGDYYRYNDARLKPDEHYPKDVTKWWLGCTHGSLQDTTPDQTTHLETENKADDSQFIDIKTVYQLENEGSGCTPMASTKSYFLLAFAFVLLINHVISR